MVLERFVSKVRDIPEKYGNCEIDSLQNKTKAQEKLFDNVLNMFLKALSQK